ncbi:MAG: hypothetical protein Q8P41_19760 [Pseudomonadota bacterium]|nr:hypothetical protein [Pseudomonadota bacterium]
MLDRLTTLLRAPATWIALALAALVGWVHLPLLRAGGILGAPGTDVIRGAWGLDHQASALPGLPFWTDRVGFPEGVKIIVLPMVSSLLGAPLHALFGPIAGYDLWVLALLWASGFAAALLVRAVSGSAAAGLLAGAVIVVQPMLLLAVTDGTPEYVALWPLPTALLATWAAAHPAPRLAEGASAPPRWLPVVAGLLWGLVALDSPYHVVFGLPFLPVVAWGMSRRDLLLFALAGVVGGAVLLAAYYGLPVGDVEDQRRGGNAVQLSVWQQWESGTTNKPWDYTLAPGFVPLYTMVGALALATLRPLRSLPWVLVALLCFVLAIGPNLDNANWLARTHGETAGAVGRAVAALNEALPVPVVRFPRRWLVPGALALTVAAGIGLSRIRWAGAQAAIAIPLAVAAVHHTLTLTGYRTALPMFPAPTAAFADFIRDHEADGALLALPTVRGASTIATRREDIPIWASLDPAIRSADQLWIQLATGRATVYVPEGMRTMERRTARERETEKLLRDLDDLTVPHSQGRPIPPSATQEPPRRAAAAAKLVERGLRFVAIDEALYGEEGLAYARLPFASRIVEERRFGDGTGVTVWVVE